MPDDISVEVAPGHKLVGRHTEPLAGSGVWRYTCSCGEIKDADTATTQRHVDDVTP